MSWTTLPYLSRSLDNRSSDPSFYSRLDSQGRVKRLHNRNTKKPVRCILGGSSLQFPQDSLNRSSAAFRSTMTTVDATLSRSPFTIDPSQPLTHVANICPICPNSSAHPHVGVTKAPPYHACTESWSGSNSGRMTCRVWSAARPHTARSPQRISGNLRRRGGEVRSDPLEAPPRRPAGLNSIRRPVPAG